jgi:conserved oligomeric Golgi complex subunit 6
MSNKENIVDARIKKVLQTRTDSVAMMESLDAISEFFGKQGNTVEARRALRQDLECQNVQLAKRFLAEYEDIRAQIQDLDQNVSKVQGECNNMAVRVAGANENIKIFMTKASQLEEQRNHYLKQSKDIEAFLSRFQLSPLEVDELYNTPLDGAPTERFFNSLKRLRQAYDDCKSIVESHQYNAGFELLDLLGQHQDVSYQRLFEWVKRRCEINNTIDTDDMALQLAMAYLSEVPSYFTECQDAVISSRRSLMVQRFIVALTQGKNSWGDSTSRGSARPLEAHAHDPSRFVGDILAWVHQAIVAEEEFLRAVFCRADHPTGSSEASTSTSERSEKITQLKDTLAALLVRCLSGIGRPFKVRVMQALESKSSSMEVLYSLSDLLMFYSSTFQRILPLENSIQTAVSECLEECQTLFDRALNRRAESFSVATLSSFAVDSAAMPAAKDCSRQILELFRIYSSAMSPALSEKTVFSISNVIGSIIQPMLQSCRTCASNAFQDKSDMAVFMLNNVSLLRVCMCVHVCVCVCVY